MFVWLLSSDWLSILQKGRGGGGGHVTRKWKVEGGRGSTLASVLVKVSYPGYQRGGEEEGGVCSRV